MLLLSSFCFAGACKVHHLARPPVKCFVFRTKAEGGDVCVFIFSVMFYTCIISLSLKMYMSAHAVMLSTARYHKVAQGTERLHKVMAQGTAK